ncbi:hypothetical protein GBA52_010243 [Prunus armeniaca]|nr:hypothetical protein GBA52_010243 [Prunus armeniaca]
MKLNLSPSQDQTKAEPWLFKPKPSSVFLVKKRLVKRMKFDQIVQCFCSVSDYTNCPQLLLLEPLKPLHHQTPTSSATTKYTIHKVLITLNKWRVDLACRSYSSCWVNNLT